MQTQEEVNEFLADCFKDDGPEVFIVTLSHLVKKHGVSDIAVRTDPESAYEPCLNR